MEFIVLSAHYLRIPPRGKIWFSAKELAIEKKEFSNFSYKYLGFLFERLEECQTRCKLFADGQSLDSRLDFEEKKKSRFENGFKEKSFY